MTNKRYVELLGYYRDVYDILKEDMKDLSEKQIIDFINDLDKMSVLSGLCDSIPSILTSIAMLISIYELAGTKQYLLHLAEIGVSSAIIGKIISDVLFKICANRLFFVNKNYDADEIYMVLEKNNYRIKE